MTVEGVFILILSIVLFATFCVALAAFRETQRGKTAIGALLKITQMLSDRLDILGKQDLQILKVIEQNDGEYIRRDEAN